MSFEVKLPLVFDCDQAVKSLFEENGFELVFYFDFVENPRDDRTAKFLCWMEMALSWIFILISLRSMENDGTAKLKVF